MAKSFYFADNSGDTFKVQATNSITAKEKLQSFLVKNKLSYPDDTFNDIVEIAPPNVEVCMIVTKF